MRRPGIRAPSWNWRTGRWTPARLFGASRPTVHMAMLDGASRPKSPSLSLDCPDGSFPSVGMHASAGAAAGAHHPRSVRPGRRKARPIPRPWLDHGRWGVRFPLGDRIDASPTAAPYRFLPAEGEGLHQIAVGPVHAGIIEPGHFRFTASGETVVRLEQRLGYVHKGIEGLMAGAESRRAAPSSPAASSGDSTVAYAYAFARAVEAALELDVPDRARVAARAAGRTGAARQSSRRHRRHLQRRLLRADARALRRAARKRAARRRQAPSAIG